jgi:hypothetical protein
VCEVLTQRPLLAAQRGLAPHLAGSDRLSWAWATDAVPEPIGGWLEALVRHRKTEPKPPQEWRRCRQTNTVRIAWQVRFTARQA